MATRQDGEGTAEQVNLRGLSADIATAMDGGEDVSRALRTCADTIVRRLEGVFTKIWILDDDTRLRLVASAGDDDWIRSEVRPSFAGYPLMVGSRVIGVIATFSPRPLDDDTVATLSGIADRVAMGLDRRGVGRKLYLQDRAIAATSNGIVITDPHLPDNPIIYSNYGFERMTGYASAEIIGRNCRFLQADDRDQPGIDELRSAIRERRGAQVVLRNYRKDGSLFYNELALSPIFDDDGELINFIGVQSDITARKLAEQERDELLRRVEAALAVRDRFISIASHELRTPITVIKGHAQLMTRRKDVRDNPELVRQLGLIDRQATVMQSLISDLLDVSRIESGELTFTMADFDLCRVVQEVVEEVSAAQPDFRIRLVGGGCGGLQVHADEVRIRQVVSNLLSNAVKYSSDRREVRVRVERRGGEAVVSVQDWGIGIPEDQQDRVFGLYFRADNATEAGRTGLGLGLHISKSMIEAHHGALWFDSTPGHGSTFHFSLPVAG
jgi:PAS domain S-box-containing protein